jgi:hypothetical protein
MKPIQVIGHVDASGKLELRHLPDFPPGEELRVLIMEEAGIVALEKLIEMAASEKIADPDMLEQIEALDEALWDMQFANSPDVLAKLAKEALEEHKKGRTVELDLDELNRKGQ